MIVLSCFLVQKTTEQYAGILLVERLSQKYQQIRMGTLTFIGTGKFQEL
uniref:Uncharacterized protein n=1 Tax=Arundo donax TaxID=35708 RepID=A0A0A9DR72_ARUDO